MPISVPDGWPTIAQVAHQQQVSPRTVRNWIAKGHLEAVRIGPRLVRVNPGSLTIRPIGGGAQ